jgi:hypothetical protein
MKFGLFLGALAHNGLSALAGIALPGAVNALQRVVSHSPYLATHPIAHVVVGVIAGAVARDMLKAVPSFAASSGATMTTPLPVTMAPATGSLANIVSASRTPTA